MTSSSTSSKAQPVLKKTKTLTTTSKVQTVRPQLFKYDFTKTIIPNIKKNEDNNYDLDEKEDLFEPTEKHYFLYKNLVKNE